MSISCLLLSHKFPSILPPTMEIGKTVLTKCLKWWKHVGRNFTLSFLSNPMIAEFLVSSVYCERSVKVIAYEEPCGNLNVGQMLAFSTKHEIKPWISKSIY